MNQSLLPFNRFFLRQQFSIYHRRLKKFQWQASGLSDYGLLFLMDGTVTYEIAGGGASLAVQQSLLFEPGKPVRATGHNAEFLLITFSPAFIIDYAVRARLVSGTSSLTFSSSVVNSDTRLTRLLADIAHELGDEEAGRDIIVAALTEQVAVHLLRRHSSMRRSEELQLSRVGLVERRIRRAVEFMQAHLEHDLPLKEIAAASYLSPFHFARLFKKLTGTTPHAYLASLRWTSAKVLLAETDLSITEISSRVGYASPSHFTKAFRQATGLTPRAFRSALVSR